MAQGLVEDTVADVEVVVNVVDVEEVVEVCHIDMTFWG